VERDHYLNAIAKTIDVSREALEQKLQKTTGPDTAANQRRVKVAPAELDQIAIENQKPRITS
jgi:hypothetical protein